MRLSAVDFLSQRDRREDWLPRLGTEPWITAYDNFDADDQNGGIYCALVPSASIAAVLARSSWELTKGSGLPGCVVGFGGGEESTSYLRFGREDGIEPLVFLRTFHGVRPSCLELSEEFRHFHNLVFDVQSSHFVKTLEDGTDQIVGRLQPKRMDLRLREVRQFLAIKEMHLAIYFDFVRFADVDPASIPASAPAAEVADEFIRYTFQASGCDFSLRKRHRSFSRLLGKKIVAPLPKSESGFWPYDEAERWYEEFIIRVDENGGPVLHSCNPELLADYFGGDPDAPRYLTPVFFRREVLAKYYANPQRYSVEDGRLSCAALWSLRMDNNHPDHVVVFLGDLGQDLHHSEQLYWKSFNVLPEGGVSEVTFRRSFLVEFTDPDRPDLKFKYLFENFCSRWRERHGWDLFLPLTEADSHVYAALRVPLINDQSEFDGQVLSLAKVVIDSINERAIEAEIGAGPAGEKGISKLARYLESLQVDRREECVSFLRDLQDLRSSGVAHRKGKNYDHVSARFGIGEKELIRVFEEILAQASNLVVTVASAAPEEEGAERPR